MGLLLLRYDILTSQTTYSLHRVFLQCRNMWATYLGIFYIMHKRIDNFNPTWNFFLKSNSLFGNLLIYSQNFCIQHSAGYWFLNRSGHCVWQSWGGSHVKFSHNLTLNTRNASRKKFRTRSLLQRKLVWKIPKIWKIHST